MKYNVILNRFSFFILTLIMVSSFSSCEQEESVADQSDILIEGITGKWVVDIDADGENQAHNTITTYNTSNNDTNAMWLDDEEHGWGLKAKVNLNYDDLTFSGTDLEELYYGVTVTITDGQIVKGGATAPSGDVVDSIYFKAEFSDIPGVIWEYYGYKSTAKIDDLP